MKERSMNVRRRLALLAALAVLAPSAARAQADAASARIVVGPNILVSRDGDVAHCETTIAANPANPTNLLGASIVMVGPHGGMANKAYVSSDGGSTWTDISFPEQLQHGGGDPQVGFGITGTAFFVGLSPLGMHAYRSEDGGRTWSTPVNLGKGHDHEMLVVDHTFGPYAGRVYLIDETSLKGSRELETTQMQRVVVLFRSSDDGRSFVGPIEVARGGEDGLSAANTLVLSDGTLFIPMVRYPNYQLDEKSWQLVFSLSSDGGVTFSPPQPIAEIFFGGRKVLNEMRSSGRVDAMAIPVFAAGRGRFRDRLYAAWTELDGDRFQLRLTWSHDRGKTWRRPKPVDTVVPPDASQFQPMIAVNPDGVLGLFWYGNEGSTGRDKFDAYFAASVDGGETILPKKRVSTETSVPFGSGNLRPAPLVRADRGLVTANFLSGLSRWPSGGDYIGLTTDADGAFHPLWADGRSGTYQVHTARIRVLSGEAAGTKPPRTVKAGLSGKVTLLFDPISYDKDSREMRVPVRLKNASRAPLYPPFTVEIKEFAHPYTLKTGDAYSVPVVLNAANGKSGLGATFDYARALGDLDVLAPDAVTDAIVWRLRAPTAVKTDFHIGAEITGFVTAPDETAIASGTGRP